MQLVLSFHEVCDSRLEYDVYMINQMVICLIKVLIEFKENIIKNGLSIIG